MTSGNYFDKIPEELVQKWQELANVLAEMLHIPAALIMKADDEFMEVLVSSESENNPYQPKNKEKKHGLYCETVIKSQDELVIPNALKDKDWDNNPDIKLGMISYLGYPINYPDNTPFGTICVLDNKENHYSKSASKLIKQYKAVIELDLELLFRRNDFETKFKHVIDRQHQEIVTQKERLVENEYRYKKLADLTFEGILIHKDGIAVDVNSAFLEMFGYTYEEIIGVNVFDLLVDKKNLSVIKKNILKTEAGPYEISARDKKGNALVVQVRAHFISEKDKQTRVASIRNVTDQKKLERKVAESERLKAKEEFAFGFSEIGQYELDLVSDKLWYNQTAHKTYKMSIDEMPKTGMDFFNTINIENREYVLTRWESVMNSSTLNWECEYKIANSEGEVNWVRDRALIERDENSIPQRLIGTVVNITELKRIEEKLKERTERFDLIANTLEIGITETNAKTGQIFWDKTSYKIHGYKPGKVISMDFYVSEILLPENKELLVDKLNNALKNRHKLLRAEYKIKRPDGDIRWILDDHVFSYDDNGNPLKWNSVKIDITDRKKLEEDLQKSIESQMLLNENLLKHKNQLEKTQEQLIQSEKMASIGLLSAGIAHEINNPINYINGGVVGLKKSSEYLRQFVVNYIESNCAVEEKRSICKELDSELETMNKMFTGINKGIQKTTQIINSMKAFSSSSENTFENVEIKELFHTALTMLYNTHKDRIIIQEKYDECLVINAIPGKLQQVIMNIVKNAIQAIPDIGEITISTTWNKKKDKIAISVKDNGVGMSIETQKKIFEPFFSSKRVGEGTGLGLYLSYSYIQQHAGRIKVLSKEGLGSEFIIELPQKSSN